METAISEITLVVFTTLAPAGVLGLLLVVVAIMYEGDGERAHKLSHALIVPLALAVVGLVASATHLGTPANALYVMTGIGRSPLSNEVSAAVIFFALAGTYWIASFRDKPLKAGDHIWLAAIIVAGLLCVWLISAAYTVSTIPTWSLPQAPATLWLDGLSAAPAIAIMTLGCAHIVPPKKPAVVLIICMAAAAVVNAILLFSEVQALAGIQTTTTLASDLVPGYAGAIISYLVLELVAAVLLALPIVRPALLKQHPKSHARLLAIGISSSVLVCAASFIVRFFFYSMYMTAGI